LCDHIRACLRSYWGFAVEQLPYESREGGYQGQTWDTADLLFDHVGLGLPRDKKNKLYYALSSGVTDELWCDYDWLTLDRDVALRLSWERFCFTVKHRRRFFFHGDGEDDRDSFTPASLLEAIARISQSIGLVRVLSTGTRLWRARPDLKMRHSGTAKDYGPPPIELALQSNRMNPPGIPMLYLASTARTAVLETRATVSQVGQWRAARDLRILDLRELPEVPGVFSDSERDDRLALKFLHNFATDVMQPIARDQRVHVDYLPSQVVTEFMRDYPFKDGAIDGVAYGSTVHPAGWNVALFASLVDLGIEKPEWGRATPAWLTFHLSKRLKT
jgi:RES domain-containing protein